MLPPNSVVVWRISGIVVVRPDRGWENAVDDRYVAVAVGPRNARGRGRALRADAQCHRAHQLPDGLAGGRRTDDHRDQLAGAARTRAGTEDPAPLSKRGSGRAGAAQAHWATARGDTCLADRAATGDRSGPAH